VVGSVDTLNLRVAVMNDGDPAHNTHLVITLPSLPNSMPKGCKDITTDSQLAVQVDCETANPLRRGARHIFLFGLDAEKSVAPDASNLTASVRINTATDNENLNTLLELSLPLSVEADVEVYGYLKLA
jgi:Integrin alpha